MYQKDFWYILFYISPRECAHNLKADGIWIPQLKLSPPSCEQFRWKYICDNQEHASNHSVFTKYTLPQWDKCKFPPGKSTYLETSANFRPEKSTCLETNANFRPEKSTCLETSANFHPEKLTCLETSANFHPEKSTCLETNANFHPEISTCLTAGGNFQTGQQASLCWQREIMGITLPSNP